MINVLQKNKFFFISAIMSTIFITTMVISDTITALNWTIVPKNKPNKTFENAAYSEEFVNWKTLFYFTFQSNLFVCIFLWLRTFDILKPKQNKHHKAFQVITTINITITMVTYWLVLARVSTIWTHGHISGALKIVVSFMVHLIMPIIMLVAFHKDKLKQGEKGIVLSKKKIPLVLIYPITWLIIAITIYFATKTESHYVVQQHDGWFGLVKNPSGKHLHSTGIAIYFFLNFADTPLWLTISACSMISILFIAFAFLFFSISNPESKLNERMRNINKKIKEYKQGK